jgi:DNA-binding response OmpR family regulator
MSMMGGMAVVDTSRGVMASQILIVEDDPTLAEVLSRFLHRDGYGVEVAMDGPSGLARASSGDHDLVVLDLMLPVMGGLEVCRRLREVTPIPVIMLTALGEEADRIAGLEVGADDYLAKPFSARELTARMKAVLRRANGLVGLPSVPEVLVAGDLEVDTATREVRVAGRLVSLTAKEQDLLTYLVRHPRRPFHREELLEAVWGFSHGDLSTVTVHVRRLREKIEVDPSDPRKVCTVWGVGYRFEP